jgi:hypothetical protein
MSSGGAPSMASKLDTTGRGDLTTAFAGRPPPPGPAPGTPPDR